MPIENARRVVWTEPGRVEMETVSVRDPEAGEVLVEAEITLISPGTERAFLLNLENTAGVFPRTGGYSMVGRVAALGPGVTSLSVGDRVVCSASHVSHTVAAADRCVPVPDPLASEEASFFNLGTIAMQGVRKARPELGEGVVVFGGGLIGLLAMRLARLHGGLPVVTIDLHASRRELAKRFGADDALDPKADDFKERLDAIFAPVHRSREDAPQIVIEATGFPDVILTAFDVAGWMARVVLLGSSRGTTPDVNFYRDVHKKGLVLYGAHASTIPQRDSSPGLWTWRANVETILRLMESGRLTVGELVTHRVPSEEAPAIYARIAEWDPDVLGVLLDWSGGDR